MSFLSSAPQIMEMFGSGSGGSAGSSAGGGGGGGNWAGAAASNPYTWLVAALALKARDTQKQEGIGYKDQLFNISLAPTSDYNRWNDDLDGKLDDWAPYGGGNVYKSSFELASGDFGNWWKEATTPFREIF